MGTKKTTQTGENGIRSVTAQRVYNTDAELVQEEYAKAFHTDCAEHIYPLSDCDRLQRINPRL